MGLYARKDSPYWWMVAKGWRPQSTGILREGTTSARTRQNRQAAEDIYQAAVVQAMRVEARLEAAPREAITFGTYTDWWVTHKLPLLRSNDRDLDRLLHLRATFGRVEIAAIDRTLVGEYITRRLTDRVGPLPPCCGASPMVEASVIWCPRCGRRGADERRHVSANTVNREVEQLKVMLRDACP